MGDVVVCGVEKVATLESMCLVYCEIAYCSQQDQYGSGLCRPGLGGDFKDCNRIQDGSPCSGEIPIACEIRVVGAEQVGEYGRLFLLSLDNIQSGFTFLG
jgi:hypothetical protein